VGWGERSPFPCLPMWISLLSTTLSGNRASNRDVKRRAGDGRKTRSRADPSNSDLGKEVEQPLGKEISVCVVP